MLDVKKTLQEYIRKQPDGVTLDWLSVEQETGISMSARSGGRRLLIAACKAERRPYKSLYRIGIRLSSAAVAADFIEDRVASFGRKFHDTKRYVGAVLEKHERDMTSRDKARTLAVTSFLGAISLSAAFSGRALPEPATGDAEE